LAFFGAAIAKNVLIFITKTAGGGAEQRGYTHCAEVNGKEYWSKASKNVRTQPNV
jgi:hypothetical protein